MDAKNSFIFASFSFQQVLCYRSADSHHDEGGQDKDGEILQPSVFQNVPQADDADHGGDEEDRHDLNQKSGCAFDLLRFDDAGHEENEQQDDSIDACRDRVGDEMMKDLSQKGDADDDAELPEVFHCVSYVILFIR